MTRDLSNTEHRSGLAEGPLFDPALNAKARQNSGTVEWPVWYYTIIVNKLLE